MAIWFRFVLLSFVVWVLVVGFSGPDRAEASLEKQLGLALKENMDAPVFKSLNRQIDSLVNSSRAQLNFEPWIVESQIARSESADSSQSQVSVVGEGSTSVTIEASRYLGRGVNFSAELGLTENQYFDVGTTSIPDTSGASTAVNLSVDLWRDLGGRQQNARIKSESLSDRVNEMQVRNQMEEAVQAYLETVIDICVDANRKESVQALTVKQTPILKLIRAKSAAGTASSADVLQIENLFLSFERDLLSINQILEANLEIFKLTYQKSWNIEQCPKQISSGQITDDKKTSIDPKSAFEKSYVIQAQNLRSLQFEQQEQFQQFGLLPSLSPFVQLGSSGQEAETSKALSDLGDGENLSYTVGLQLNWFLDNDRGTGLSSSAKESFAAQRLSQEATLRQLRGQIQSDLRLQATLEKQIDLLKRQLEISRKRLDIEVSRNEIGRSSALSLASAYQDFQQVTIQFPEIVAQWYKARWRILSRSGQLTSELAVRR